MQTETLIDHVLERISLALSEGVFETFEGFDKLERKKDVLTEKLENTSPLQCPLRKCLNSL
ncbi:MAG: hypothetical protein JKY60_18455 [Kordiimonadaceae bacterium]|nr:hypothetical protein [Kordiimonadaceae bacterium]